MYIDGGTGSMLLQAGAAVFFTGMIFFKDILRSLGLTRKAAAEDEEK